MRIAASPAPPDHDISHRDGAAARALHVLRELCLAAIASFCTMTAFAQSGVPCTAIADDAERLACYDKALRPAAPAPAARTPEPAPRAAALEPAAPTAPTAPRGGARANENIVPIVVVGMRALPGREATFTTEDGVAWVQVDSQRLVLPDTPFAAEIRPGAMGSYFLVPTERGRAVRVRPVR